MIFHHTELKDARLIELNTISDDRGFFARSFCAREFAEAGLVNHFVQQNSSQSLVKGAFRGLHWQRPPHGEVKVMRCLRGAIYQVIVDVRPDSPTYRRWQGFELSADNRLQLYVPEGFANGYQALTDAAEVAYFVSRAYMPGAESGLRHDDPAIGISLPLPVEIISEKDRAWPDFVG
jgi:dTDP-4-dehydrorhamnose 3,5-epimerase